MDFSGEYRVPAPRDRVWEALNDPAILKVCIDGCEELVWTDDNALKAVVRAKVGPVSARFTGKLELQEIEPPRSYVLAGQGQGGAAGFAKGSARVTLEEDGAETLLRYEAVSQVGGKLASVGQRLVQGVATKTAEQFFERFTQRLQVALRAEAEGLDLQAAEDEVFEVRPVELPEAYLSALEGQVSEDAPVDDGPATRDAVTDDRPIFPILDAKTLIIPAGFGLFLIVMALLFLLG